jgi:hypothetical protein
MKFILTIDTEGDNQWDHGRELTVENIKYVTRFQNLFEKYYVKPTYLVTSEICKDSFANEIFKGYLLADKAEIGAHLHSWTTSPFLDMDGFRYNDTNHAFATELPENLINEKIKNLTDQIENSFGIRPLSFRSGRFGFNEDIASMLYNNSYIVDSSITPYTNWAVYHGLPGGIGGPNFMDKKPFPFRYDFNNGSLIEIPVTILPTRFPLNKFDSFGRYYFNNVDNNLILKVLRRLWFKNQPLWLRPLQWMDIRMLGELVNEAIELKLPYIVMMFHSSELMPGCSIYRKDENEIEMLYDQLESFFILLNERNIPSQTLTEAAKKLKLKD